MNEPKGGMIQEWGNVGSPELGYFDEIVRRGYLNLLFVLF